MCGDNHLAKQLKQYVKCHYMRCGTADLVHAHYIITSRGGKNDPFSRVDKEGRKEAFEFNSPYNGIRSQTMAKARAEGGEGRRRASSQ